MVLYADVLICINIIIDYFLINLTSRLLKCKCSLPRQISGSVVGGLSSLTILIDGGNVAIALILRVLCSSAVILATYGFGRLGTFLRRGAVFFGASFLFSGCMAALAEIFKPRGLAVKNGVVYYNLSALSLVLISGVIYCLLTLMLKLSKRNSERLCRLTIKDKGCEIHLTALLDSGSRLHEPFSEKWVILLDPRFAATLKGENKSRRIIPFSTVSGEGVLSGFLPDKITLEDTGEQLDMYIAFSPQPLGEGYGAILSEEAI